MLALILVLFSLTGSAASKAVLGAAAAKGKGGVDATGAAQATDELSFMNTTVTTDPL